MLLFAALTLLPAAPAITQQGEAISEAEAVDLADYLATHVDLPSPIIMLDYRGK